MSYHFRSSREDRRNTKKLVGKLSLAAVFLLIALGFLFLFPHFVRSVAETLSFPFRKSAQIVSVAGQNFFSLFSSKTKLSRENNDLKEQLLTLNSKLADRNALALQNEQLLVAAGRNDQGKSLLAALLERPPASPYDTFTIDAGEKDGLKIGDQIFIGDRVMIGAVIETFSSKSRAKLYSSSGEKFQAVVGKNRDSVEVVGQGGGNFSIKLPRAVPVSVGDTIMAPSLSPKVFGEVGSISVSPNDSFQIIYFRSPINIQEIQFVKVLLSHD